jgi:hypothetical protein
LHATDLLTFGDEQVIRFFDMAAADILLVETAPTVVG